MTIPVFPQTPLPDAVGWRLRGNTQVFRSPLSGGEQILELPGARWVAELSFRQLLRSEAAELEAFLDALVGSAGLFTLWNHARATPRGVATGAPLVAGAAQIGKSLLSDGWTASTVGILLAGDMIEFGGELKRVTADVNSDVGGLATVPITPAIRTSPNDNAVITVTRASATFRLRDDDAGSVQHTGALEAITLTAVETF